MTPSSLPSDDEAHGRKAPPDDHLWEITQARLAQGVVLFTMFIDGLVTVLCILLKTDLTASMLTGLSFLNITCTAVISFYFSKNDRR